MRPIAVGGMLVGAAYTLFKMRKSLTSGFTKLLSDMRQSSDERAKLGRTERYMSFKIVLGLIALMFVLMCALYVQISGLLWPAILAAVVMLVVGFFFATVSGNLVGFIGSSNNPVSGLTLSTLLIAALLMVSLGVSGEREWRRFSVLQRWYAFRPRSRASCCRTSKSDTFWVARRARFRSRN